MEQRRSWILNTEYQTTNNERSATCFGKLLFWMRVVCCLMKNSSLLFVLHNEWKIEWNPIVMSTIYFVWLLNNNWKLPTSCLQFAAPCLPIGHSVHSFVARSIEKWFIWISCCGMYITQKFCNQFDFCRQQMDSLLTEKPTENEKRNEKSRPKSIKHIC